MSTFQTQASLEKIDNLLKVTSVLIHANEGRKFLLWKNINVICIATIGQTYGVNNDVKTANLSKTEFILADTSLVHLLPHPIRTVGQPPKESREARSLLGISSLPRTLHSSLVLPKIDQRGRQPRPVGNAREQEFSSLIQVVLETLLSNL